jgi:uncharacterized SAM-binding protein YcdF (DUF218 family)
VLLPIPFLGVFLLLAAASFALRKKDWAIALATMAMALLLVLSTPFVPDLMVEHLEQSFPCLSTVSLRGASAPVHVLVLGAGHTSDTRLPANDQLSDAALGRLIEGIRIHRLVPGSILITSGYAGRQAEQQAEVMGRAAALLGVAPADLRTIPTPKDTSMEATEYRRAFGNKARLVLVTGAIHMPRAMALFRRAGLDPIADPLAIWSNNRPAATRGIGCLPRRTLGRPKLPCTSTGGCYGAH